MKFVSTPDSVKNGEVSLLGVAETIAAVTVVFVLSAHFNTLRWLAVAICLSPLLLLRTEDSTRLGIALLDRWGAKLEAILNGPSRTARSLRIIYAFTGVVFVPAMALVVRMTATIVSAVRAPVQALRAIPGNWSRMTLSIDSNMTPDLVPEHPDAHFLDLRRALVQADAWWLRLFMMICMITFFLPAYMYRWSVKATSIIYTPLVFIVHTTFREVPDLRKKLELIKRSDVTRILGFYAICYVAAFLVKLVLMMILPNFAQWWNGGSARQFAALYVAPAEIPKWQIASLTNSVLALGVLLFARHALLRIELGTPWPEGMVQRTLGFTTAFRTVLALYTILCTGYITINAARGWHWPLLGEKWLPWQ